MHDNNVLSQEQVTISTKVDHVYAELSNSVIPHVITPDIIAKCIAKLKRNSSPGIDGITAEFIINGKSPNLCKHLSSLYSTMLTYNSVPSIFNTGVMVPILKKPTLNPGIPANYRPIIVSSVFSKLFELIIIPNDTPLCNNQFGFRTGLSVSNGLTLLNDIICYSKYNNSNVNICSLDAEKCFDSIWHDGLFYKLINVLSDVHWRFLRKWYKRLDIVIKWNGIIHKQSYFKVSRGTRQGSIISPVLFNIFLSDLMVQLSESKFGMRIGDNLYSSFAYADDISLFDATVPGLQELINICMEYSQLWRFNFGISKSKCMVAGKNSKCFVTDPVWHLGSTPMDTVSSLDILGVTFNSTHKYDNHVNTRIQKCKRSMYSLSNIGMAYPGLNTLSKTHLYKTICKPTLMYGIESLNISNKCVKELQSTQGFIMKQVCGLSKRSHHSGLLQAVKVESANVYINNATKTLFRRLCATDSTTRNLCIHFLNKYIMHGTLIPGTIIDRIVGMGVSPSSLLSDKCSSHKYLPADGLVDSLRAMLLSDNYIKPWSNEYMLVKLLTRSF